MTPSLSYPTLQLQSNEPIVLVQTAFAVSQLSVSSEHSSISAMEP